MDKRVERVVQFINKNVSLQELLMKYYKVSATPGRTFRCPFHSDDRKSAKLFNDNHFICFAEGRQYSSYSVLKKNGYTFLDLEKLVPQDFECSSSGFVDDGFYRFMSQNLGTEFKKTGDMQKLVSNWNFAIDYHERGK